jgi:hypothetical protein
MYCLLAPKIGEVTYLLSKRIGFHVWLGQCLLADWIMLTLPALEGGDTKLSPTVEAPIPLRTFVATRWPWPPPWGAEIHRLPAFWILHVSCIGQWVIQRVGRYLLVRGIEMIRQELLRGR